MSRSHRGARARRKPATRRKPAACHTTASPRAAAVVHPTHLAVAERRRHETSPRPEAAAGDVPPWCLLGPLPFLTMGDLLEIGNRMNAWLDDGHDEVGEAEVWACLAEDLPETELAMMVATEHIDQWLLYCVAAEAPAGAEPGLSWEGGQVPVAFLELARQAHAEQCRRVADAFVAMGQAPWARFEVVAAPSPEVVTVRHLHHGRRSETTVNVALPYTYGDVAVGAGLVGRIWPGEAGQLRFAPDLLLFSRPPTPPSDHVGDPVLWLQLWFQFGCHGPEHERRFGPGPSWIDRSALASGSVTVH